MDESTKREIIQLLTRASEEFDITILIVTHELGIVKRLCDRVAILEEGKLVHVIDINKDESTINLQLSYSDLAREVLIDDK